MHPILLKHFTSFEALSPEEIAAIDATIEERTFKKGTILLAEGEHTNDVYFVLEGIVRQYFMMEGEEKTQDFFTEGQWVLSATNLAPQSPSPHFLVCNSDCLLAVGHNQKGESIYQQYPKLGDIARKLMQEVYIQQQKKLEDYLKQEPQERYTKLFKHSPELLQRVPQYQIASYVGVTPESLSRIRKRLLRQH